MIMHFCVCRLKVEPNKPRKAEVFLRYKGCPDSDELCQSEPVFTSFAFPLGPDAVPAKEYMASEEYTFTLTFGDGRRLQGFCRQFLPPQPRVGSRARFPLVLVLVAEYPWCTTFFKVLQILEQFLKSGSEGLLESGLATLPSDSAAGVLLRELGEQLAADPQPGQVIKLALPSSSQTMMSMSVSPPKLIGQDQLLCWSDEAIELQAPTDSGNGRWNCGVALARLLWHVPVPVLMTLFASLLLERRVILVSQARDTVTAAVQAAAALLYPFRWHHIYLPLLPRSLSDYLSAPMPYLVGLPAQMLPMLRGAGMDEVTLIDLDLGKCDPMPGSERDDAVHLPWRRRLEAALQAAVAHLKSPTEYESSPLIASIFREYILRLLGGYRRYVQREEAPPSPAVSSPVGGGFGGAASAHTSENGGPPPGTGQSPQQQQQPRHSRNVSRDSVSSSVRGEAAGGRDEALRGSGFYFDQQGLVSSHRHSERARRFLAMLRHSQLYEVFIQERLRMAADHWSAPSLATDPFELHAAALPERRRKRLAERLKASPALQSHLAGLVRRHRRVGGEELAATLTAATPAAPAAASCGATAAPPPPPPTLLVDAAAFFEDDERELEDLFFDLGPAPSPSDTAVEGTSNSQTSGGRYGVRGTSHSSTPALFQSVSDLATTSAPSYHISPDRGGGGVGGRDGSVADFAQAPSFAGEGVYEGSIGDLMKLAWRDIRGVVPGRAPSASMAAPAAAAAAAGGSFAVPAASSRTAGSIGNFFDRIKTTAREVTASVGPGSSKAFPRLPQEPAASAQRPYDPTPPPPSGKPPAYVSPTRSATSASGIDPRSTAGGASDTGGGVRNGGDNAHTAPSSAATAAPASSGAPRASTPGPLAASLPTSGEPSSADTAAAAAAPLAASLLGDWDPFGLTPPAASSATATAGPPAAVADPFVTNGESWDPFASR